MPHVLTEPWCYACRFLVDADQPWVLARLAWRWSEKRWSPARRKTFHPECFERWQTRLGWLAYPTVRADSHELVEPHVPGGLLDLAERVDHLTTR